MKKSSSGLDGELSHLNRKPVDFLGISTFPSIERNIDLDGERVGDSVLAEKEQEIQYV